MTTSKNKKKFCAPSRYYEKPEMMQAKSVFVASYCSSSKCQSIGSGSISLVGSGQRSHLSSRHRSRCRDYIRPHLESGNGPKTIFWNLVGPRPTYNTNSLLSCLFYSLPPSIVLFKSVTEAAALLHCPDIIMFRSDTCDSGSTEVRCGGRV